MRTYNNIRGVCLCGCSLFSITIARAHPPQSPPVVLERALSAARDAALAESGGDMVRALRLYTACACDYLAYAAVTDDSQAEAVVRERAAGFAQRAAQLRALLRRARASGAEATRQREAALRDPRHGEGPSAADTAPATERANRAAEPGHCSTSVISRWSGATAAGPAGTTAPGMAVAADAVATAHSCRRGVHVSGEARPAATPFLARLGLCGAHA